MNGTRLALLVLITPPALTLSAQSLTPDEKRCLEESKVWNNKRGKCKSCKGCPYGEGRNFTVLEKLTRRTNGNIRCPPCDECPQGSYNNNKSVKCSQCQTICSNRNRHLQTECTRLQDATCGTCLPGFIEQYHNADYPCLKMPNHETVSTGSYRETSSFQPVIEDRRNVTRIPTPGKGSVPSMVPPDTKLLPAIVISLLALLVIVVFPGLFILKRMRMRKRLRKGCIDKHIAFSPDTRRLTDDNGLEIDTSPVECQKNKSSIVRCNRPPSDKRKISKQSHRVRTESRGNYSRVRAENEQSLDTPGPYAIPNIHRPNHPMVGKKCLCQQKSCDCCNLINIGPTRILGRDDPVFRIVAANVCHDPTTLFQGLGIPFSDIYQIDNDRDRAPEKISESEMVYQLLQRWVEKKTNNATLRKLCNELCKADFHGITQKILETPPPQPTHTDTHTIHNCENLKRL